MKDLLVILNPRRIEECISSYEALEIDKLWVSNMTEYEIRHRWPEILELAADYGRLIVQSDDGIVRPHALSEIRRLLNQGHPVVTGYSNLSSQDFRVNLSKSPLKETLGPDAYELYTMAEVMEYPIAEVPTYLAGMCITGMSHAMWQRFAFTTYWDEPPGNASDYMLSRQLNNAGVEIIAARDAFVWHVKQVWNTMDTDPRKRLYVYEHASQIVLEPA